MGGQELERLSRKRTRKGTSRTPPPLSSAPFLKQERKGEPRGFLQKEVIQKKGLKRYKVMEKEKLKKKKGPTPHKKTGDRSHGRRENPREG